MDLYDIVNTHNPTLFSMSVNFFDTQEVLLQCDLFILVRPHFMKIHIIEVGSDGKLWPIIPPYVFRLVTEIA